MPILMGLLEHTANLCRLTAEQYPAPLECYNDLGVLSTVLFAHHCAGLMDTIRDMRQPKNISFATEICHRCGEHCVYVLGSRLCPCWQ